MYNEKIQFKKSSEEEKRRQTILENLMSQVTREVQKENFISDGDECKNSPGDDVDATSHEVTEFFQFFYLKKCLIST